MKKILIFTAIFLATALIFAQTAQSPVQQMDDAVRSLARDIHAKLVEKNAERVAIGQFTFNGGVPAFSTYWVNQLINELANMQRRNYIILSGNIADAQWTISGEIVQAGDIIRVFSRLIRTQDRAIEGSFFSNFQRDQHINTMISGVTGSGAEGAGASGTDTMEPDNWDSPVSVVIGSNPNSLVMNRTLTAGDEDFFLIVPDRDGRLTVETTGSGTDTYLHFYNYDTGDELATNDDGGQGTNCRLVINVRSGTRYLAVIRGFSGSTTGAYGFRAFLIVREGASSFENPLAYQIGENENTITTVNRTLGQGDEDFFLLVPARDGRLTIETTGRIDTYLELYDANQDLLAEDDDGGQNFNARIRYTVTAGTRYIALVRGYSDTISGNYGFRAFFPGAGLQPQDEFEPDNEPNQAKNFVIGTAQNRTFHSGNDVDWVRIQITRSGRYIISARGATNNRLDTYIELYDSNINIIAEDDDGGEQLSSRLSVNLNIGTYFLKVWCLDEEPDQGYVLNITPQ